MRLHRRPRAVPLPGRVLAVATLTALLLSGCSRDAAVDPGTDPAQVDALTAPEVGACRDLAPSDVAQASNASVVVGCTEEHTAQTFAAGSLPSDFADAGWDDRELGAWAYRRCSSRFQDFLGADQSLVMRSLLSWAWFRPSQRAWEQGARWFRCDVVGGGEQSTSYAPLPADARGLLAGRTPDEWMVCVAGPSVSGSAKLPCSQPHDWRAVTTIKLGEADDPYPGDRVSEVRTRDFCSDSVGAWLGYPDDFGYGYTWFHEAEWEAGNRRAVCWAETMR